MLPQKTSTRALGAAGFGLVLLVWWLTTAAGLIAPHFLPGPGAVAVSLATMASDGTLLTNVLASAGRVLCGYGLTLAVAIPLGVVAATNRTVGGLILPLNNFLRYIPMPAFIPLTILWAGIGLGSQVTLIFLGTAVPLLVLVTDAVAACPKDYLEAAATIGAPRRYQVWNVMLRNAGPQIFDYCRNAFGWAWSALILCEIVAASSGIGHMIVTSQRYLRSSEVLGGVIAIGLFGLTADFLFRAAAKKLFPWRQP